MSVKKCRHCDIGFYRDDGCPIPHDRCERCHEEIEALNTPLCADGRPCGQQDHPDDDAYCLKCPHEPKFGPADVAIRNKYEKEGCDMTDEHPLDRLAQAGLVRAAAKWERGDMEARSNEALKGGLKFDADKPRMELLIQGMPRALEAVGAVLTFGAQKYEAHSWQHVEDNHNRYWAAKARHDLARAKGEQRDPETGLLHLAHEACNTLFLLELALMALEQ